MNLGRSTGFRHGAFIKWMPTPAGRAALPFMESAALPELAAGTAAPRQISVAHLRVLRPSAYTSVPE